MATFDIHTRYPAKAPSIVLTIRNAQIGAFDATRMQAIIRRVLPVLAKRYDHHGAVSPELEARLVAHCRTAWSYGLRSPAAIGDFLDLGLQLGSDFHNHHSVRAILNDPSIPATERMRTLMQRLQPNDWRLVREWLISDPAE